MSVLLKQRWSLGHNYLAGITHGAWWRLLADNRFQVSPAYWHRAAFITLTSLVNSGCALAERLCFGSSIANARLARPPLFILGHWRSGTTLLHNLLAQDDEQFHFANTYQVVNPYTFLTTERFMKRWFSGLVPGRRPMDNMQLSFETPQEDEFAPLLMTLRSVYLGISFPQHAEAYAKYLSFRDASPAEIQAWQEAFGLFCRKVMLNDGRTLLLKSPAHTARIRMLLQLYPDARFVHIHRDPYRVFQSQRHFFDTAGWYTYLQRPDPDTIDESILARHEAMYDAYFEDSPSLARDRFCEVRFTDLETDPVGEVRKIYQQLKLDDFAAFQPKLSAYTRSLKGYEKNRFSPLDDATRKRVAERWERSFSTWGYSTA